VKKNKHLLLKKNKINLINSSCKQCSMNNKLVDILNRGIRYLRYIPSFFRWILTAKNWYEIIFLHLNLIRRDIHLNLRNGLNLRLMNRGENSDTVTLSELYWDKPYTKDGFDIKNNDIVHKRNVTYKGKDNANYVSTKVYETLYELKHPK